jgi:CRISPR-associated protein Cmr2
MPDMSKDYSQKIKIALSWCLAWGEQKEPRFDIDILHAMRQALLGKGSVPQSVEEIIRQVDTLQKVSEDNHPKSLVELKALVGDEIWQQSTPIGLIYGGATKIKQYVFESANLMEIRGASAILDRINLVDLPGFFDYRDLDQENPKNYVKTVQNWLAEASDDPQVCDALIPELIVYSTGGNILALCPAAYGNVLADMVEKRYTEETLMANSCAVSDTFRLLEFRFGCLATDYEQTPWLDYYQSQRNQPLTKILFGEKISDPKQLSEAFFERKSFNELAGKLAIQFNQRRSGNITPDRRPRCYPPMLETHPYLQRDDNGRLSAIAPAERLAGDHYFSETQARKYRTGQITKREKSEKNWLESFNLNWSSEDIPVESWVSKFEKQLNQSKSLERFYETYFHNLDPQQIEEARSLEEVGNASEGFITFIYADGNNMGGYIQTIKTPEEYAQFSQDIFEATEQSVYYALAKNLRPHHLKNLSNSPHRNGKWVHPFEIITIGGDDVLLIIPGDQGLQIAKDIAEEFERILASKGDRYGIPEKQQIQDVVNLHRYQDKSNPPQFVNCRLSTSLGVLTIAHDTPIYYADKLVTQLLKSAKKGVKDITKTYQQNYAKGSKKEYFGSTIDILTLKSVTMISSNINEFRKEALEIGEKPKLKLYATPYTPYEIGGLINTIQQLKAAEFPRSQLYQLRSILEQGKRTTMLNYHYFRTRLKDGKGKLLQEHFEKTWCSPKEAENYGSLAPWMSLKTIDSNGKACTIYETIWRDIVDLYPFIPEANETDRQSNLASQIKETQS